MMATSGMSDELERYKQLLNDWNVGKSPKPSPANASGGASARPQAAPASEGKARAKLVRPVVEEAEDGRFPRGAILCLNDEELVIYRRPVADKPLDMVYSLLSDGLAKIEAVDLTKNSVVELGQLSPAHLKKLQTEMRWTRDLIAFNCFRLEDSERIPEPSGTVPDSGYAKPPAENRTEERRPEPRPAAGRTATPTAEASPRPVQEEPSAGKRTIRRGQRVTIKFGDRMWDAVYWGMDQKGTVVAHCTHGHWTLMHLDLNRFKETMVIAPEIDQLLVKQIAMDLEGRH
jgi:hypothetical protein